MKMGLRQCLRVGIGMLLWDGFVINRNYRWSNFQFMLVPGWRARYKAMKEAEKDHEDAQEEMATDSTEEEEEESEDDESKKRN